MAFDRGVALSLGTGFLASMFFVYRFPDLALYSLVLIFTGVSWFAYSFTHPDRFLQFLRFLKNPPMTGLIVFFFSFILLTYRSYSFGTSFAISFALSLLGGLAGAVIYNYWNIGS